MTENWPFPFGLGLLHFFGPVFLWWQCFRVFVLRKPFSDAPMMAVMFFAPAFSTTIAGILGIRESDDVAFLGYSLLSLSFAPVILAVMIWVAKARPNECKMVHNIVGRPRNEILARFFAALVMYALLELALYYSIHKFTDPTPCSMASCHSVALMFGDKHSAAGPLTPLSILVGLLAAFSGFCLVAYFYRFESAPLKWHGRHERSGEFDREL